MTAEKKHTGFRADLLVEFLSPTVGDAAARHVIADAVSALQLNPHAMSQDEALAVLERVAHLDGLIGVAARFAKTRIYLA